MDIFIKPRRITTFEKEVIRMTKWDTRQEISPLFTLTCMLCWGLGTGDLDYSTDIDAIAQWHWTNSSKYGYM